MDESRIIRSSGSMFVYVPPKPQRKPDDLRRDFPPGDPPQVHYVGRIANYWDVMQTGEMHVGGYNNVRLTTDQMDWLRSIENAVEKMLDND
jgi:hypothetical protein